MEVDDGLLQHATLRTSAPLARFNVRQTLQVNSLQYRALLLKLLDQPLLDDTVVALWRAHGVAQDRAQLAANAIIAPRAEFGMPNTVDVGGKYGRV